MEPIKPFTQPSNCTEPTIEITEYPGSTERDVHPYTTFVNHLYVYPLNLSFDSQKLFSRARNLAIVIELRECDTEDSKPLQVGI